jgi:hypothetical protein
MALLVKHVSCGALAHQYATEVSKVAIPMMIISLSHMREKQKQ